jgi:hypothetical protein
MWEYANVDKKREGLAAVDPDVHIGSRLPRQTCCYSVMRHLPEIDAAIDRNYEELHQLYT